MSRESRMLAGVILMTVPTVMFGGATLLSFLVGGALGYVDNPLRHDLWARLGAPIAAILIPAAFFLSTLSPTATSAGAVVNLAYLGAAALGLGVLTLGIGLIRAKEDRLGTRA